jgi:putative sterol carrier protein
VSPTVQYRVVVAKKDERVDGPDDADVVITVPVVDAVAADFNPTVAFMRGTLKASGRSGEIFAVLKSGEAATAIAGLVAAM